MVDLFLHFAVPCAPLRVMPPSPFVEIAYHIGAVYPQEFLAVVASLSVIMDDSDFGIIHCAPSLVHASRYVDVFRI